MYGGYPVYLFGLVWFCIWSLIAGFSTNELMLDISRAIQGLGPAAFLPSGVLLMGNVYRPGPRKNIVFSLYGGSAPLGFFFGGLHRRLDRAILKVRLVFLDRSYTRLHHCCCGMVDSPLGHESA
jgi:MFS family permease